jgi:polar amino acid transport system permease protein
MASVERIFQDRTPRIEVTDGALIPIKGNQGILSAWRITFFLAVAFLCALLAASWYTERKAAQIKTEIAALEQAGQPVPASLSDYKPLPYIKIARILRKGLPVTFVVTIFAICGSIILGLLAGIGQIVRFTPLNRAAGVYVELIRGIPLLVQLIFIYYALGKLFRLEGIPAAVIALSICYGAYQGEIFRAGIQSIPKGQMEAAIALGLTRGQAFRHVILPQTVRVVLPAIGNEFIAMLKDTSLVSILAVADILRRGREYVSVTFQSFETYLMVALFYLIITLLLSKLVAIFEDRMKKNER